MERRLELVAVPSALGAPDFHVADGPAAIRAAGLRQALEQAGWAAPYWRDELPAVGMDRWDGLAELTGRLARRVAVSVAAGRQSLVIGGDHSIAVGTWRGVAEWYRQPVGLLWIDAHLDAHTPADSPTGNPHGMPVALLLGEGDPRVARACLSPRHVCLLGARNWEAAERRRLERLGVRIFDQAEIEGRGLADVLVDAIHRVSAGTAGFGVSFDLDVFDPTEAPGVCCPVAGGLPAAAWLDALRGLGSRPGCLALEIVECDPARDVGGATAALAIRLAVQLLAREAGAHG